MDTLVTAGFVHRYRHRRHLAYLPPPEWVRTAPTHTIRPHVAEFAHDEMGKRNFLPIVLDGDYDAAEAVDLLAPVLRVAAPAPRELRVTSNEAALRDALAYFGFGIDRVQLGMRLVVLDAGGRRSLPADGTPITSEVADHEIADLYNACFGLTLTTADVARMRSHADWVDTNLFAVRSAGGQVLASLRLLIDIHADGTHYGFLRGLAVRPDHRRASMPLLAALYGAARGRAAEAGVADCHMLVDRPTERSGRVMRGIYGSLGFREEVMIFRMRQSHP